MHLHQKRDLFLTAVYTGWGRMRLDAGPGLTQTGRHRTGVHRHRPQVNEDTRFGPRGSSCVRDGPENGRIITAGLASISWKGADTESSAVPGQAVCPTAQP